MTTLSAICDDFQTELETLEPADDDLLIRLKGLVTRLATDAVEHVADHGMGEIPALLQRSHEALAALAAEAEDPEDRRCRYRRQAAVLNLVILADRVARYHAAPRAEQRKTAEALRDLVAGALAGLDEPAE